MFLCFTQSVASTRWLLQDEMHIANTPVRHIPAQTVLFHWSVFFHCQSPACIPLPYHGREVQESSPMRQ